MTPHPAPVDGDLTFRPIAASDLPSIGRWLARPHVTAWWRDPAPPEAVEAKYLPRIAGVEPTDVYVICVDDRDVGIIQSYRLRDHGDWQRSISGTGLTFPDGAGMDYLIGEQDLIGRGLGTRVIEAFTDEVFGNYHDVDCIVVTPQAANRASCRALEKAGYDLAWTGRLDSDDPSDAGTAALYVLRRS